MLLKITGPVLLVLAGVATGCGKEPSAEVAAARDAVEEALEAQGESYAGETTTAAQELLSDLEAELETQNHKWAPLRSYDRAESLAAAVATLGTNAAAEARTAEATAREAAADALDQVRETLKAALTELETAPRGKGSEVDLEAMRLDLIDMGSQITEIENRYREGEYTQASAQAAAVAGSITEVREAIAEAVRRQVPAPGSRG
jgi:hypothetical protein